MTFAERSTKKTVNTVIILRLAKITCKIIVIMAMIMIATQKYYLHSMDFISKKD